MPGVGSWSSPSRPWARRTSGACLIVVARAPLFPTPVRSAVLRFRFLEIDSSLRLGPKPRLEVHWLPIPPRGAIPGRVTHPAEAPVLGLQRDVSLAVDLPRLRRPLPVVHEAVVGTPVVVGVEVSIAMAIIAVIACDGAVRGPVGRLLLL